MVWQLGLLRTMGFGLDPYSMLVPFLVFAIGISHGVQIINNVATRFYFGMGAYWSARRAFRALYVAGFIALISDGIGFLTLMVIEIPVIQELALTASIGVAVLIFTNLLLMPVLLSYTGLTNYCMTYIRRRQENPSRLWPTIAKFREAAVCRASSDHRRGIALFAASDSWAAETCVSVTSTRVHPNCVPTRGTTSTTRSSPRTTRPVPTCSSRWWRRRRKPAATTARSRRSIASSRS